MAVALNTPLAEALSHRIQPKLVEIGWSVGEDDSSPLSEYICLMLVNGKSQSQIASELSGDLLGLGQDDSSTTEFAQWLFAQVEELQRESGGQIVPQQQDQNHAPPPEKTEQTHQERQGDMDMDMGMADVDERVPTGPKAMRNSGPGNRRMMNQLSRAMERRPDDRDPLHRMRPQGGGIDKNRKFDNSPRGHMNNRGNMNRFNGGRGGPQNRMNGGRNNFNPMTAGFNPNMTPEQQMQFYQMFQQQAQMMTPFVNGPMPPMPGNGGMRGGRGNHMGNNFGMPHHGGNGFHHQRGGFQNNFHNHRNQGNPSGNGSLFERIQAPPDLSQPTEDTMADDVANDEAMETASTTSQQKHNAKPEEVPCKFGAGCTKPECIFGHPTPAAGHNRGIMYVSGERCPFGTGCKNRKCTGSHPSPATASSFTKKIDQDCKFFPNCTNPNCQFRHPPMPMCRNGPNCTRPDCHFSHTEVPCRYNPCLNPNCPYKHEEGQQQAPPESGFTGHKVWKAPTAHVSERKFVNEQAEEELIIPGQEPASTSEDNGNGNGGGSGSGESGTNGGGQGGEGLDTAEMLDEGVDDML